MVFDPDCIEREVVYNFKIKVKHCGLCPFSEEHLDECGDYIGNTCTINQQYVKFPESCEEPPDFCVLRKKDCNIKVTLK